MSSYPKIYMGPYIEVTLPPEKKTTRIITCTNKACKGHGIYMSTNFCSTCGSPVAHTVVEYSGYLSMHEFFEKYLGEEDMFSLARLDITGIDIIIPNNTRSQGGAFIEDQTGAYEVSKEKLEKPCKDWDLLVANLKEQKIEFNKKFGVVYYFN